MPTQNFVIKTEKQSQKGALIFLAFSSLTIFSFTVLRNSYQKIKDMSLLLSDQKKQIINLEEKIGYLNSLDKNDLDSKVRLIEEIFPSQKPVMSLITSLKKVALENNVSFNGITLSPGIVENPSQKDSEGKKIAVEKIKSQKNELQSFPITITVKGKINDVFKYIDQLKTSAPLIIIDSLDISNLGKGEEEIIQANLGIVVYYQSPPLALPSADSPIVKFDNNNQIFLGLQDYRIFPPVVPNTLIETNSNFFRRPN